MVPRNQNRHYWKIYPNSFTGKAAVETMCDVLAEVFPTRLTERSVALKVMMKFFGQGIIIGAHSNMHTFRDDKDAFYKFGELDSTVTDTVGLLDVPTIPRRSVSMDETNNLLQKRRLACDFSQAKSSLPSTSTSSIDCSHCEAPLSKKDRKKAVNSALLRFIQWVNDSPTMDEVERQRLIKKFKSHYPRVYNEFLARKSTEKLFDKVYHDRSQDEITSDHIDFDTSSCDGDSNYASASSSSTSSIQQVDSDVLDQRLLEKLNQVCEDPIYTDEEKNKIIRYYRRFYPQIYYQRFPEENHPLLKRLRNLFPKLNEKLAEFK
ncbi:unnamed protein product [Bursaphelenchus okinawaensis]|uniref:DEP domain-containing protein n=1 Tax=Bursaphelenchus okinawaensis TaxID=465554 RepID=A0A811K167_9BILA|nr:unnamed protein product [Bursaphelenchus okinawaensis]CAG9089724.1 unnamed protein product [Bursaphelenchus okinawaensis]